MAPGITVVFPGAASRGGGDDARVLLADLDDPALSDLLSLPPTAEDHADLQRPLAAPATYFLRRRAFLRHAVADWSGVAPERVVVRHDAAGAPRVLAPDAPFVSVSARASLCAVALSARPVGVDIETGAPAEVVWAVLHPAETRLLRAIPADARARPFLTIWTAKEAVLKAQGLGLKRDPAALAVVADGAMLRIADPRQPDPHIGRSFAATIGPHAVLGACVTLVRSEPTQPRFC